jgi:glycosyltransferase involved in cell wall biosynthesis
MAAVETVCHVITKLELGGAQEVALYVVSHLDRAKFRPVLVTGPGGVLTEEAMRLPAVEVVVLPALVRRIHGVSDVVAFWQLTRLFRRLRPAIVHTHSSKAGILGRWAAWCARVPVIVHTIHGYGMTPAQPAWLRRLLMLLERVTGWITTQWIAVAQADVQKGLAWKLFNENVSVVRPGIDPQPFQTPVDAATRDKLRAEFGAGPDHDLVGTVACLKPQKAPEDFVAVAKRVCDRMPRARFVLIGDGELRPCVEALIRQHGLADRIRLAGWRRDIPTAMQAFDAFLLTSHWEGLPRVLIEARTAGLPIIATLVGGAEEVVVGWRDGRLCRAGDVDALAEGVQQVFQAREQRSQAAMHRIEELPREFHIGEMVKQYESLYDRFLAGRHRDEPSRSCVPVVK